jgi:hypothetical protein
MDLVLVMIGLVVLVVGGWMGLHEPTSNNGGLTAIAGAIVLSTGATLHYFVLSQRRKQGPS